MTLMTKTTTIATPEQVTAFEQFLRKCIKNFCLNGEYRVYFDYRDEVEEDTINEAFFKYVENDNGYSNFSDYLEDIIYNEWNLFDHENYLIDDIEGAAREEEDFISDILEYTIEEGYFWDYLYDVGYQGISWDIHDIVSDTKVNLLLATKEEINQDLSSIATAFLDEDYNSDNDKIAKDNALNYLIRQQGYFTKSEEFLTGTRNPQHSKFLNSIEDELNNAYCGDCHCLTVLASASLDDLDKLADILLKKETAKQKITVSKDCEIGLFAPFVGGGSTLEIQLDKDFEIPVDMLYDVQIEHRGNYSGLHGFYTVDSVYSLVGSCWRADMKFE